MLLTLGSALQRWVPMRRWSRALGRPGAVPERWRNRAVAALPARWASPEERAVTVAVRRARRLVPWNTSCLAEAFAAQVLLRQAAAPGVVVVGLRAPDGGVPADRPTEGGWPAHAWLLGRHGAITGGPAAAGFTPISVFEVPGGLEAARIDPGRWQPVP